jgi:hypothetical protein
MKPVNFLVPVILGLALAVPASVAAAPGKTRCLVNRESPGAAPLNTFVFHDVVPLNAGESISLRGIFFTSARKPAPFHGSAIMAADGSVRLGLFVHSSADATNDFTLSGVTDTTFAGTFSFDNDGDFVPNGTLLLEVVNCDTIVIP